MAWGTTYTASANWQNAAAAGADCAITWNVTLATAPSGSNGVTIVTTTSGGPPSGPITGILTTGVTVGLARSGSSGVAYAIVGHSVIA